MLSVEISTIYKRDDRTRKVHHLIYLPDLDAVGPVQHRAGPDRQPRLGRPADPRPGLPRPAGDHAGGQPGRLPGAGAHLDAVVLRAGLEVRLRRDRRLLRRPGRAHLRGGDRPVLRPGDELAGRPAWTATGWCPTRTPTRRRRWPGRRPCSTADAGLLRGPRGAAHRRRPGRHDRVLPGGGQVPRRRAPGLRRQLGAGADPGGRRPLPRVRQAADRRACCSRVEELADRPGRAPAGARPDGRPTWSSWPRSSARSTASVPEVEDRRGRS